MSLCHVCSTYIFRFKTKMVEDIVDEELKEALKKKQKKKKKEKLKKGPRLSGIHTEL